MNVPFKPIQPLLYTGTNKISRWFSYVGLGIGVLLLLCSLQMYINIEKMLTESVPRKSGFDFISITKTITNETMGQEDKNSFHPAEIEDLEKQSFIEGVSPLIANQFRVQLSAGTIIPFQTDLFIETIDNDFIDTVPPTFSWQPGTLDVPIILSSDFLEIYNVFAPGQGLPQVSEETASGIPVMLTCEGNGREQAFRGRVVAFSDRINSVLVPKTFLDWANKNFGNVTEIHPNRIFLKMKDANDPRLLDYLDQKHYNINKDKTKFGRVKQVLESIFTGLGIFGLLVVVLALMLFSFYLQLMIARSKDNLQLLLTLGYSPQWLSANVTRKFIPVYFIVMITALAVTQLMQSALYGFAKFTRPGISPLLHWSVFVTAGILILLALITNHRIVKKLLYRFS